VRRCRNYFFISVRTGGGTRRRISARVCGGTNAGRGLLYRIGSWRGPGRPKLIRILVRGGVRAYRRVRFSNENSRRAFRFFVGRDTRALRYTNDDVERSANRSKFTEYLTFGYGSNEITVFKSNRHAHLPGTRKPSALRTSVRFIYTATRKSILLVVRLGSRQ